MIKKQPLKVVTKKLFNPLYFLRKKSFFVKHLMPIMDVEISVNLHKIRHKVWLKSLRDLSWTLNSSSKNQGISCLFLSIIKTIDLEIFWDVGANIGFFSWLLSSYKSDIEIIMFEPDTTNIHLLSKTIESSSLKNIKLICNAVSDEIAEAGFAVDKVTGATGTLEVSSQTFIQKHYNATPEFITVKTTTLDHVWHQEDRRSPNLIKIDVEGSDLKVFRGAGEMICKSQPILIFECSANNKAEIISTLRNLNYKFFDADNPDGNVESAYNILALPPHYHSLINKIFSIWKAELKAWKQAEL